MVPFEGLVTRPQAISQQRSARGAEQENSRCTTIDGTTQTGRTLRILGTEHSVADLGVVVEFQEHQTSGLLLPLGCRDFGWARRKVLLHHCLGVRLKASRVLVKIVVHESLPAAGEGRRGRRHEGSDEEKNLHDAPDRPSHTCMR